MNCRNYRETETNSGNTVDYCKAAKVRCRCSGLLAQCDNQDYFNVPEHRWEKVRLARAARGNETIAELGVQK